MKYNNDALQEMCSKFNLLDYISSSFELTKKSGKYFMSCPKHLDKTPSLCINEETNRYYCFSCQRKGSPIDWFKEYEDLSFNDAVEKLARLTNTSLKNVKQCEALTFYKATKRLTFKKPEPIKRDLLRPNYMSQFDKDYPAEWLKEGITKDVMDEYDIRCDRLKNRIVYPVYDNDGNLIAVKGRTRFDNYADLGITKYQFYQKIGELDFFVGWKQAEEFIEKESTVYIFEGIKSVMHVRAWKIKNAISSETSHLSNGQIQFLIQKRIKNVVLCYDSDVSLEKITKNVELLKKFCNVYIIYDNHKLLGEKMSPCDKGLEIFNKLLEEKRRLA